MNNIVSVRITDEGIVYLKMQDEKKRNIFSDDFLEALIGAIDKANELKPKVMIIEGIDDVFSAGAEKQTLMDLCDGKIKVKDLEVSEKLVNLNFPVISAMKGHAMGGGFVIAMCSDIVIASLESRYGAVFMSMGFTPGMGTTTLLQDLVGPNIANEMMFTARRYKGSELAKRNTNINYILPKNEVMKKAEDIALQICEKNIKSINLLKYALSARKKKLLIEARLQEDMMHALSFGFPETKKTIESFYA